MTTVIDAHVHVRPGWERDGLLDAAWANVGRAAGPGQSAVGVLMLAEISGEEVFGAWSRRAQGGEGSEPRPSRPDRWRLEPTAEDAALVARGPAGEALVVVAGRQVRSDEGLEVLAQGSTASIVDGGAFPDIVARALEAAPLVSIPWAFGKWWGARGRLVARTVTSSEGAGILLSDNGLRPRWSFGPPLIRAAHTDGRAVLAGTDPLPLPGHETRVASYGVIFAEPVDLERPVAWLTTRLTSGAPPRRYGAGRSLFAFLSDQVRLRWS